MLHYVPFVLFFEGPEEFSAETGEMHHKTNVASVYQRSNKKKPEAFVIILIFFFSKKKFFFSLTIKDDEPNRKSPSNTNYQCPY